uniref:Uncharacterized protein n=1 Tax=Opuntia streptacantha TaxID=393608 RepID=A0A7C9DWM9_OPUST
MVPISRNPLVFNIKASAKASRRAILVKSPQAKQTMSFVTKVATIRIIKSYTNGPLKLMEDTSIFIAAEVTKNGRSIPQTKESNLSTKAAPSGGPSGKTLPTMTAPKNTNWPK